MQIVLAGGAGPIGRIHRPVRLVAPVVASIDGEAGAAARVGRVAARSGVPSGEAG